MTAVTQIHHNNPIQAAEVQHITASWAALLTQPIRDNEQLAEIKSGLSSLTEAPRKQWMMARVVSLLSQYYAADVSQGAVKMMAEDWAVELEDYPEWAIEKAVRWWKSAANPDRKKRPLEGDISARAKVEAGVISVGRLAVKRYEQGRTPYQSPDRKDPHKGDPDGASRTFAAVGYKPNRFGHKL